MNRSIRLLTFAALLATSFNAQTTPPLQGIVSTRFGAPVKGVVVTALDAGGSSLAHTTSDPGGIWRIDVNPACVMLRFTAEGFQPKTANRPIDLAVLMQVEITAEENATEAPPIVYHPVVDTQRTQQADFITARQLLNLPVNTRNYISLALLTPGVVRSDQSANGFTDLHPAHSPQSGLSIGGSDGRGNIFWLDGAENYLNTGGVRTSISQEAVAEFQVSRSSYAAEYGWGIGGIVNTVSRHGENSFHGDVFGFLETKQLMARNYFDKGPQALTRVQSGATFSGPFLRNGNTQFFAAFEQLDRHEKAFSALSPNNLPGLTSSQQQLATFLQQSGSPLLVPAGNLLAQSLDVRNFPATVAYLAKNAAPVPLSQTNSQGSVRIDHRFSDNDQLFGRFNMTAGTSSNIDLQGLQGSSNGEVNSIRDTTLLLNNNYVANERWVSETRLALSYFDSYTRNNDRYGPEIDIEGIAILGQNAYLPSRLREQHLQFQQNMFYSSGRHSIRFGVDVNPVRNSIFTQFRTGGQFVFASFLPLSAVLDMGPSGRISPTLSTALDAAARPDLAAALNQPITALQAFNLGIPISYNQSFGNPGLILWTSRFATFLNDVYRATSRLTLSYGVRYEVESDGKALHTDFSNADPRLAFAWQATADGKTLIRAGAGLFHMRNNVQIGAGALLFQDNHLNLLEVPITGIPGSNVNSASLYQGLNAQGIIGQRAIAFADLKNLGVSSPGAYPILVSADPRWRTPYAEQASFELERALGGYSVSAAYNYNRALHLPRIRDLNTSYAGTQPNGSPVFTPIDSQVALRNQFEPRGFSSYNSLTLQLTRRFSTQFTLDAHYTFSKAIDDATQIDELPNNSLNLRADKALSSFDQRHRFVADALISPKAPSPGMFGRIVTVNGLLIAPIFTANSGIPFNLETGLAEGARPFPLGRNVGHGPAFYSADIRISRDFVVTGERLILQCGLEGYNLSNHTNFLQVNNIVGITPVGQLPHPLTGSRGNPLDPLSFISAGNPRQMQIVLKLRW